MTEVVIEYNTAELGFDEDLFHAADNSN